MEVDLLMGVKCSSDTRRSNSRQYIDNQVLPGMTSIICRRCRRELGQAYSTNSIAICDKCGYRFYIRICGGVEVTMPARYIQYKGYYDDADEYMGKVQKRVEGEQILINEPVFEIEE